jgi:hypothetical protein
MGHLEKAIFLYEETLEQTMRKLGPDHSMTLQIMENLARTYCDRPDYAKAEPLLVGWLDKQRARRPATDQGVAVALRLLGECRLSRRQYGEAEQVLRDSFARHTKILPRTVLFLACQSALGAALAGQKKDAEAEPHLLGSARVFAKLAIAEPDELSPAGKKSAMLALERLINYNSARGNASEADQWRQRLVDVAKRTSIELKK